MVTLTYYICLMMNFIRAILKFLKAKMLKIRIELFLQFSTLCTKYPIA